MDAYLEPPGFLGTGASLLADVTLLAYLLLIIPSMILGLIFARRGMHRPQHKWLMIAVTVINWVLIIFLMFAAYRFDVAPNLPLHPENSRYLLPALHGLLGIPAQLLATFVVLRMLREDAQVARAKRRGEKDTSRYWFRSAKPAMRLTLLLWLLTASLGVLSYLTRYNIIPAVNIDIRVAAPVATAEITAEPPIATEEADLTPEATPDAPATTPELQMTAPEVTPDAPVSTPELTPDLPVATREATAPAATPEAPVTTPEVAAPVETPELEDSEFRVEGRLEAVGSSAVIVDGQRYTISGARIDDVLRVGAFVRVEGRSVNGERIVERIRVEEDDD